MASISVLVLIAAHNRRDTTVAAVRRFSELAQAMPHWDAAIYLADDGSTDGTADAVAALDLPVKIVHGPGNWFWARSMAEAWRAVDPIPDAVLWLNDDVLLADDALVSLDRWHQQFPDAVLVGQVANVDTGEWAAGGRNRVGRSPLRHVPVVATSRPVDVNMPHGQFVFVPRAVSDAVGRIDGEFSHGAADFDYGLRVVAAGYRNLALPGYVGTMRVNPTVRAASIREALRFYERPLGYPFADRKRILERHGGRLWPVQLAAPYAALLAGYRPHTRLPYAASSSEGSDDVASPGSEGRIMSTNGVSGGLSPVLGIGPLARFAADTYSQNGEDGILAEVLHRIGNQHERDRWCVEFGAWDGVYLSNTARLIREDAYRAVLIEGDPARAEALAHAHPGAEVHPIAAYVGFDPSDGLDALLASTPIPADFDLLSVDIDGCDYHVWESVQRYRPKVVIIEYNWTIPNAVHHIQPRDLKVNHSSSAASMVELATQKGYVAVACTPTNLVFVAEEFADAVLGSVRPGLDELRDDSEAVCYLFFGQDGTVLTSRTVTLPWAFSVPIPEKRFQVVPKPLRHYRGGQRRRDKVMRLLTAFAVTPSVTSKRALEHWRSVRSGGAS